MVALTGGLNLIRMREALTGANLSPQNSLRCDSIYKNCTEGIAIKDSMTRKKETVRDRSDLSFTISLQRRRTGSSSPFGGLLRFTPLPLLLPYQ
ncbi:MAG TPA: hypothetical protein DCW47_03250 [Lachnospiraceae bacterium]|nr:hypothetical protein [Lachnospiraceae bacterium]